jgi:hypothetical protein
MIFGFVQGLERGREPGLLNNWGLLLLSIHKHMSTIICAGSFQWESELQPRSGGGIWCGSDFKIDAEI